MTERERQEAAKEARREVTAHPERLNPHEDAISRYLGGIAYAESHRRATERTTDADAADGQPAEHDN